MNQFDASLGLAGAAAISLAAYAIHRRNRRPEARPVRSASRLDGLLDGALGLLPPEPERAAAPAAETRAPIRARRVTPMRAGSSPRAATARPLAESDGSDLLSLISTVQWSRALRTIERMVAAGRDLGPVAAQAEAAALERARAVPEADFRMTLGAYRVLAALAPTNAAYRERVAQAQTALEARRDALLGELTRDEDRSEPGTVWLNHPWNARFDDLRRPIWLYLGLRPDGEVSLRLRTNWLGDSRICVRGLEVVHDGMAETLTQGAYKIDADALGWEWRDEAADIYQLEVLRSILGAGEVGLRYKGDPWPCETMLSAEDRTELAEMIELYDLLALSAPEPMAEAA